MLEVGKRNAYIFLIAQCGIKIAVLSLCAVIQCCAKGDTYSVLELLTVCYNYMTY